MGSAREDLLHGRLRRRPARVNQVAYYSRVVRTERLCPSDGLGNNLLVWLVGKSEAINVPGQQGIWIPDRFCGHAKFCIVALLQVRSGVQVLLESPRVTIFLLKYV